MQAKLRPWRLRPRHAARLRPRTSSLRSAQYPPLPHPRCRQRTQCHSKGSANASEAKALARCPPQVHPPVHVSAALDALTT
eukprot:14850758-Alexandrium_andersonii.AAC.1